LSSRRGTFATILGQALVCLCLLLWPLVTLAQQPTHLYTIKKGDTLWGLSQRFIKDPYYWPNLWANNPSVTNPHFIYPGQQIAIRDGRIVIVPGAAQTAAPSDTAATGPADRKDTEVLPPEPVEEITVKAMGGTEGFISFDELEQAGLLVDANDDRILLARHDRVYMEINDPELRPGDRYTLIEVAETVKHPKTGAALGHRVNHLGEVEIIEVTPPTATGIIRSSTKEITRGARLIPARPAAQDITLRKAAAPLDGYVIAGSREKIALSQNDIVYLDLGSDDGLKVGNMIYLSRPRKASRMVLANHELPLPDEMLGAAVVLSTQPKTAAALVLKSANPIYVGDQASTPMD
jgi:LysM repeat protein